MCLSSKQNISAIEGKIIVPDVVIAQADDEIAACNIGRDVFPCIARHRVVASISSNTVNA